MSDPQPLLPWIEPKSDGIPCLIGMRCEQCSATFTDARLHCASCGARDCLNRVELARTGRLHAYSIIYRSFPEVSVPYISAVVDLDGGGTIKANLMGVEPDPSAIEVGMAVELAFRIADQRGEDGTEYLVHGFQPAGSTR